jgi:hypothetical protein
MPQRSFVGTLMHVCVKDQSKNALCTYITITKTSILFAFFAFSVGNLAGMRLIAWLRRRDCSL